jgi:hypothetical protein
MRHSRNQQRIDCRCEEKHADRYSPSVFSQNQTVSWRVIGLILKIRSILAIKTIQAARRVHIR